MLRKLASVVVLAGAVGVPYAVWNEENPAQWASGWLAGDEGELPEDQQPDATLVAHSEFSPEGDVFDPTLSGGLNAGLPEGTNRAAAEQQAAHSGIVSMSEVLRMDITPGWVTQRWPRVTTTLADTELDGLRVPYVSGTSTTDVTGSLTFYFDSREKLQRITFHGTTGDPHEMTALLTQRHDFRKQQRLGGELYTQSWLGQTSSGSYLRTAGALNAGQSTSQYEILLEMNRASWRSSLSDTAAQLIE